MGQVNRLRIVNAALALRGTPYVWGGGHGATPGRQTINGRTGFDCSGCYRCVLSEALGHDIGPGASESQWVDAVGGRISIPNIAPGMGLFFAGSDGNASSPGHVGVCITYNPHSRQGTYLSAYDTADGTLVEPFVAGAPGWTGALDPASAFPDPKPTAAQLAAVALVHIPNVPAANEAIANGWPLYYFLGPNFVAQQHGQPTGVDLYASVFWQSKNPHA